jgi:hypothetical protein
MLRIATHLAYLLALRCTIQALEALKTMPSAMTSTSLLRAIMDQRCFYRIRMQAATALARVCFLCYQAYSRSTVTDLLPPMSLVRSCRYQLGWPSAAH